LESGSSPLSNDAISVSIRCIVWKIFAFKTTPLKNDTFQPDENELICGCPASLSHGSGLNWPTSSSSCSLLMFVITKYVLPPREIFSKCSCTAVYATNTVKVWIITVASSMWLSSCWKVTAKIVTVCTMHIWKCNTQRLFRHEVRHTCQPVWLVYTNEREWIFGSNYVDLKGGWLLRWLSHFLLEAVRYRSAKCSHLRLKPKSKLPH
jgi:hypothetical protein